MKLRKSEKTLRMAASKAGMDRKTARKYLKLGKVPSQCRPERHWRTRPDPFEEVWPEIEATLKNSPTVEATTVFEHLCRLYPGRFEEGQLRTLQRRFKMWRARHGEQREVMFAQAHRPGEQAQSDFTDMRRLGVRIAGREFFHLLYHFVLTYSNWESATVCFSESFESLSTGLQNALWELGAVPVEHRTDRLSTAVNNLNRAEEFTGRYRGLLKHYGLRATHAQAGQAHENGDVEQSHYRLKRAVEQELLLRGSRDFADRGSYEVFLKAVLHRRNASRRRKLEHELPRMRPLPSRRLQDFTRIQVRVSSGSTIRVRNNVYSVDSRLIREEVRVRVYAEHLEVRYGGQTVDRLPRLRGENKHRINYRHVIHSLVRKPGASRRYRYREDMFPSLLFRAVYDQLREQCQSQLAGHQSTSSRRKTDSPDCQKRLVKLGVVLG